VKAAVVREYNAPVSVGDVDIDTPAPREVVVRTEAAGICHSDVSGVDGTVDLFPLPMVLGHESAGVVEAVGAEVTYVKPGDHVVVTLGSFCGHCEFCLTGRAQLCAKTGIFRRSDEKPRLSQGGRALTPYAGLGSFAEQVLVHENSVARIPVDMPFDRAALLGCGITTGLGAVINTAKVSFGASVAVIGCGGVGLSVIQGATLRGASRIIAIEPSPARRDLARQFGATDVIDPSAGDVAVQVRDLLGDGVDYSFEVVGRKETCELAMSVLRRGGLAVVVGVVFGVPIEISGTMLMMECGIRGSGGGSSVWRLDVPRYAELYMQGRLKLDELVTRHISLHDVNSGLDDVRSAVGARSVITF